MTCIVGWANDEIMVVAGDSAGVGGLDLEIRKDPKVFIVKQKKGIDAIIGFTSSFRMGQLLMFREIPEDRSEMGDKEAHFRFMVTKFVPFVRKIFKSGGYTKIEYGVEEGGSFVVAYRGVIYKIESDFQAVIPLTPFAAVGCGESYAMGALHLAYNLRGDKDIRESVNAAILIAEKCSAGVRAPMNFVEVKLK
jgi:ATP-dependent protease HslVU (ClpYQ) peptidase subunit